MRRERGQEGAVKWTPPKIIALVVGVGCALALLPLLAAAALALLALLTAGC